MFRPSRTRSSEALTVPSWIEASSRQPMSSFRKSCRRRRARVRDGGWRTEGAATHDAPVRVHFRVGGLVPKHAPIPSAGPAVRSGVYPHLQALGMQIVRDDLDAIIRAGPGGRELALVHRHVAVVVPGCGVGAAGGLRLGRVGPFGARRPAVVQQHIVVSGRGSSGSARSPGRAPRAAGGWLVCGAPDVAQAGGDEQVAGLLQGAGRDIEGAADPQVALPVGDPLRAAHPHVSQKRDNKPVCGRQR